MSTDNGNIIGALPPPPGVTPNFQNPPSIEPAITGFNIFLVVIISIVTFIRLYTGIFVVREFTAADYATVFAYCAFLTYFSLLEKAFTAGAAGKHIWDVPITALPESLYWGWVSEWFYFISIASVRLAISLQYMQLFVFGRTKRFWVIASFIAVNLGFYISLVFVNVFQCNPVAKAWDGKLEGTCMGHVILRFFTTVAVFNLSGDIFLFAYPLYFIWGLHASKSNRLALAGLFGVGLLGVVAAILRLVYSIFYMKSNDLTFNLTEVGECTIAEIAAGMLVASLISFPAFYNYAKFKLKGRNGERSSRNRSVRISDSGDGNSGSKRVSVELRQMDSGKTTDEV